MKFTEKENKAIAGVLSAIVYADGIVHSSEIDYLARVGYELGISSEVAEAGMEMEPADVFEIIALMDSDKKKEVEKIILNMAYADKKLSPEEYEIVVGIAMKCGLMLDE